MKTVSQSPDSIIARNVAQWRKKHAASCTPTEDERKLRSYWQNRRDYRNGRLVSVAQALSLAGV